MVRIPLYRQLSSKTHFSYRLDPFRLVNGAPPPPSSIEDANLIPEATAVFFSKLTFNWITPVLVLGYNRPVRFSTE